MTFPQIASIVFSITLVVALLGVCYSLKGFQRIVASVGGSAPSLRKLFWDMGIRGMAPYWVASAHWSDTAPCRYPGIPVIDNPIQDRIVNTGGWFERTYVLMWCSIALTVLFMFLSTVP